MLVEELRLLFEYLRHRQQPKVLEVLVGILDEEAELGDAELHGSIVIGQPGHHCTDALVEQRHGRGAVDEVGEGLHQLLPQSRLQGGKGTKLGQI